MAPYADDDPHETRPRRRKHRSSHRESHSYERDRERDRDRDRYQERDRDRDRDSLRYGVTDEHSPHESRRARARAEYYTPSPERRRRSRDDDDRHMAYERTVRRKASARRVKAEPDSRRRRSSKRAEEDDEYVYRSREREEEPRRRRTVRHVQGDKDLRRAKSRKGVEELVVEEVVTRPVHRSVSVRESPRPYMATRPARRNTTTRVREVDGEAADDMRSPPPAARESPVKTRRNSTGFLGIFRPVPAPAPVAEKRVDCVVCFQEGFNSAKAAKLSCGHGQCHECLRRQFELSVKDPQHMPPRCCTDEHIPLKHVDRLFNDKFKMLWNKKYEEYTTKNRLYCPYRECGQWIKPSNVRRDLTTGRTYARCGKCKQKVCVQCNGKYHVRRDCPKDEETKRLIEMAKEKGWQRCYNCKTMVELKEGCYHMTCRCQAQFCMLCAAKWKSCTCPWFEHPALDPNERLLNMQIPQTYQVPIDSYRRPPSPPSPRQARQDHSQDRPRQDHSQARQDQAPVRRSNTTTSYTALPRRSTSLRQSNPIDHVTRFFQTTLNMTGGNPTPPSSHARSRDVDVQVYGVGNAGGHHLNESYAVRPQRHSVSITPSAREHRPAASQSQAAARSAWRWGVGPRREVSRAEKREVSASVMAGLSKGGGRTGSGRVDTWRVHVRHSDEAVRCADGFEDEVWSEVDSELGYES